MIAQPAVASTGFGHRSFESAAGGTRGFVELDPETSPGDQEIRDAAGPVPGAECADGDRARQGIAVEEGMGVRVALALEVDDGGVDP
ncbi:hypothetical protein [Kocuria sabuli]|uniref:hypothetical protein n=1 Tax=Kocuria sabuli TaxID=3071448 RepID=UPI0034D65DF9